MSFQFAVMIYGRESWTPDKVNWQKTSFLQIWNKSKRRLSFSSFYLNSAQKHGNVDGHSKLSAWQSQFRWCKFIVNRQAIRWVVGRPLNSFHEWLFSNTIKPSILSTVNCNKKYDMGIYIQSFTSLWSYGFISAAETDGEYAQITIYINFFFGVNATLLLTLTIVNGNSLEPFLGRVYCICFYIFPPFFLSDSLMHFIQSNCVQQWHNVSLTITANLAKARSATHFRGYQTNFSLIAADLLAWFWRSEMIFVQ